MAIYHKYTGELWDDLDLEDLVGELSDFLLDSGFGTRAIFRRLGGKFT